ncbi:MAG: hypothetical protein LBI29_00125 [Rickettsiales bacterium]|jgi:steroid 5-alpha reductase family enzyme|nr:hypothetical protein [Rickettsiales bacterium]
MGIREFRRLDIESPENQRPNIFENSRCEKSSSIVLEYVFFVILISIVAYSVVTAKDIPNNTATLLKWIGIVVTFGVEGYKINERICDTQSDRFRQNSGD